MVPSLLVHRLHVFHQPRLYGEGSLALRAFMILHPKMHRLHMFSQSVVLGERSFAQLAVHAGLSASSALAYQDGLVLGHCRKAGK